MTAGCLAAAVVVFDVLERPIRGCGGGVTSAISSFI